MALVRDSLLTHSLPCGKLVLICLRWIIILAGFWFVINGWVMSIEKYLSGKTSVSFVVNETDKFLYPSITFCPGFKSGDFYVNYKSLLDRGDISPTSEDMEAMISNVSFGRKEFLKMFAHGHFNITDSNWLLFTPNLGYLTGECFTYKPQVKSEPGLSNGISFWIDYPVDLDTDIADDWFIESGIILHDCDRFFYYAGQDMPSSTLIDMSKIKFGEYNSIIIDYSRFTSLSTNHYPCSSDESYSFMKCYEKSMAKQRGCQKPWFYFPEFGIRICDNVSEIEKLKTEEHDQATLSAAQRATISGCPPPCDNSIYKLEYSISDYGYGFDIADGAIVTIYFKNFRFQYSEEYLFCDLTCLIGEIGGNFGFFLGGSVLALYDLVYFKFQNVS